jgi:outer membrane protein assembly factor BamB
MRKGGLLHGFPIATLLLAFLGLAPPSVAQDWPQFRGPDGQGHAQVQRLPLRWSDTSANVKWKTPIEGLGWSSPVVAHGRVWLTTAIEGGRSLRAITLDAQTGKVLGNIEVFHVDPPGHVHSKNSYASPTPILESDRVYVHFGTYGTACLSEQGAVLWKQTLRWNDVHGPGGSPLLEGELLVFSSDGTDLQQVVALDRRTGLVRWKTPREPSTEPKKFAFSTPLVIEVGKTPQVVSPGAGMVTSYELSSGRPVWQVRYPGGYSVVPRPVTAQGLVFISTGFDRPTLLAIRPDGRGDVTQTHVAWKLEKGAPLSPSPVAVGEELYVVSDHGVATCLDAKTGKVHWQERLDGNYSASPIHSGGMIYFQNESGVTTVVKAETAFSKLARNEVKGRTLASLAAVEGALFLRTDQNLLRIDAEEK